MILYVLSYNASRGDVSFSVGRSPRLDLSYSTLPQVMLQVSLSEMLLVHCRYPV